MDRRPTESTLQCIGKDCKEKPIGVLVGQHEAGGRSYQVQVMHCEADTQTAWEYVRNDVDLKRITFDDRKRPTWLDKAQAQEVERRKSSTN